VGVSLRQVSVALRELAPSVRLLDGDGRALVRSLVHKAPKGERVAVIFDGEKRQTAYETFASVRQRISLAVFDDTNLDGDTRTQRTRQTQNRLPAPACALAPAPSAPSPRVL
jgi:hypothetical protein